MIRALAVLPLVVLLLAPRAADAFSTAGYYRGNAWSGGGDDRPFTGARRWRGYGCPICHVPAADPPRFVLDSDPPSLAREGVYTPEQRYLITVAFFPETLPTPLDADPAIPAGNGFAAEIAGASGDEPAGDLSPCVTGIHCPGSVDRCDPDLCGEGLPASTPAVQTLADGTAVVVEASGATSWQFAWTAPPRGAGELTLHVAAVDGNSDRDPTGDAVAVARISLQEGAGAAEASAWVLCLAPAALRWRRRR